MAKTRLNVGHREQLKKLAQSIVEKLVSKEIGHDKMRAKFEAQLAKCLDEQAPLEDMLVLKKYGLAYTIDPEGSHYYHRIDVVVGAGGKRLREAPAAGRLVPNSSNFQLLMTEGKAGEAATNWIESEQLFKLKVTERMQDYNGLIEGTRNFEDLVEAWPEAEKLREAITGTKMALMVITSEALRRIEQDSKAIAKLEKVAV